MTEAEKLSQKLIPCRGEPEGLQCTEAAHDPDCPALHRPAVAQALALRDAQIAALEKAIADLLALPAAIKEFGYLDKGVGTATENAAWLRARAALADKTVGENQQ